MNDIFAAVVHDVKNQLAELAFRLEKRDDAQQELALALSAARRLTEMLLVYRHEHELLSVNPDSVDAADFLAILAAEYRQLFPRLRIEVNADHAPAFAFFDDALVRVALANALHNACRFGSSRVMLSAHEEDKLLVLQVSDDGAGFPQNILSNGGELPSNVSYRGTGLGLFLAKRIAESHHLNERHGRIELSNADGAVFRMLLP